MGMLSDSYPNSIVYVVIPGLLLFKLGSPSLKVVGSVELKFLLKTNNWRRWVAQMAKQLPSAQAMISRPWD